MSKEATKKTMQEALEQRIKEKEAETQANTIQGLDSIKLVELPAVKGLAAGK